MRISDWSSDVCSSDLTGAGRRAADQRGAGILQARLRHRGGVGEVVAGRGFRTVVRQRPRLRAHERIVFVGRGYALSPPLQGEGWVGMGFRTAATKLKSRRGRSPDLRKGFEIGRASCRERVCQYV